MVNFVKGLQDFRLNRVAVQQSSPAKHKISSAEWMARFNSWMVGFYTWMAGFHGWMVQFNSWMAGFHGRMIGFHTWMVGFNGWMMVFYSQQVQAGSLKHCLFKFTIKNSFVLNTQRG